MGSSETLLERLQDIDGLDAISVWPLAIGWWVVIIFGIVLISAFSIYLFYRLAFKRSWRNDTLKKLAELEKKLSSSNARETIITLSEYLRRIALRRFSRQECAGLTGKEWLKWLSLHDPKQFDWENKGKIIIEVPYAPSSGVLQIYQIKELIQAVRYWVR